MTADGSMMSLFEASTELETPKKLSVINEWKRSLASQEKAKG